MRIYLSGPISLGGALDLQGVQARIDVFTREAERLRDLGHEVENPCEVREQPSWEAYMRIHLPTVCSVDLVALLPDWSASRGSVLEVFVANQVGVPVCLSSEVSA